LQKQKPNANASMPIFSRFFNRVFGRLGTRFLARGVRKHSDTGPWLVLDLTGDPALGMLALIALLFSVTLALLIPVAFLCAQFDHRVLDRPVLRQLPTNRLAVVSWRGPFSWKWCERWHRSCFSSSSKIKHQRQGRDEEKKRKGHLSLGSPTSSFSNFFVSQILQSSSAFATSSDFAVASRTSRAVRPA
jgi:hypothetical protein